MRTAAPLIAASTLLWGVGCSGGPYNAPFNASISADVDTIYVANAETFWYADGIGSALKMRILVTAPDRSSGEPVPLNNVWVEIQGPTAGVYLLPEEAVQTVAYPSNPSGNDAGSSNVRDQCTDDNGNVTNSGDSEWCAWYYDESSGGFLQLSPSYAGAGGFTENGQAYGPNYLRTGTNSFGRVDAWLFIDALPYQGEPPSSRRRSSHDVGLDTGHVDTGIAGDDGDDGGAGETAFQMGDALITASIGHDTTTIIITPDQ